MSELVETTPASQSREYPMSTGGPPRSKYGAGLLVGGMEPNGWLTAIVTPICAAVATRPRRSAGRQRGDRSRPSGKRSGKIPRNAPAESTQIHALTQRARSAPASGGGGGARSGLHQGRERSQVTACVGSGRTGEDLLGEGVQPAERPRIGLQRHPRPFTFGRESSEPAVRRRERGTASHLVEGRGGGADDLGAEAPRPKKDLREPRPGPVERAAQVGDRTQLHPCRHQRRIDVRGVDALDRRCDVLVN